MDSQILGGFMFAKINQIEDEARGFKRMGIADLSKAIQEEFTCSEDNADAVIVRTHDTDFTVIQIEDTYLLAFGRYLLSFDNVTLIAWYLCNTKKYKEFGLDVRTVTIEITIH